MNNEDMKKWTGVLVGGILDQAVAFREGGDEIPPVFFLVTFPDGEAPIVYQVNPQPSWGDDREGIAHRLRVESEKVGARYVVHLCEAWMSIPTREEAVAAGAWVTAGYSLEDYPDKTENILLSVDGPDLNQILLHEIHADGSVGERQSVDGEFGGTFHNLSGHVGSN